jgi:hypothetical protein
MLLPRSATHPVATWAEHLFNRLLLDHAERTGLNEEVARQFLRIGFAAKVTWALPLVGLRRNPKRRADELIRLGEVRNRYVHYKWKRRAYDDEERRDTIELQTVVERAERTVQYLHLYEEAVVFGGKRAAIGRLGRRPPT